MDLTTARQIENLANGTPIRISELPTDTVIVFKKDDGGYFTGYRAANGGTFTKPSGLGGERVVSSRNEVQPEYAGVKAVAAITASGVKKVQLGVLSDEQAKALDLLIKAVDQGAVSVKELNTALESRGSCKRLV